MTYVCSVLFCYALFCSVLFARVRMSHPYSTSGSWRQALYTHELPVRWSRRSADSHAWSVVPPRAPCAMDSLCLTVSAVAAITTGSAGETQARANERAGVEEGAERLTRPELNRENSRASNERQRMAAAAKPGTTIPPYHHTTTVWPYVYACLVGRVWSTCNAACPRVAPL